MLAEAGTPCADTLTVSILSYESFYLGNDIFGSKAETQKKHSVQLRTGSSADSLADKEAAGNPGHLEAGSSGLMGVVLLEK